MNRSFFFCLAACRTRSSPWDTLSRLGVRRVPPSSVFPLAPALGSTGSAAGRPASFAGFIATTAGSDFSRPCIIGYGSSPSRCGPTAHGRWSGVRSPGSRARSVCTCQGLRPRGTGDALALTRTPVLPSAVTTASASRLIISRLNGWPMHSPADASPAASRPETHGSGPVWIATPSPSVDFHHLLLAGLPAHCHRNPHRNPTWPIAPTTSSSSAAAERPRRCVDAGGDGQARVVAQ